MKRNIFIICLIFLISVAAAQTYEGQVIHSETGRGVAFANIMFNKHQGVISDIDGFYSFTSSGVDSITVSFVGFKTVTLPAETVQLIKLSPKSIDLDEVVITPGLNPALRIVNNVVENRDRNHPESLDNFSMKAYDKLVFTIHEDSLAKHHEKIESDTSFMELVKFFDKQHLFLVENVTETQYNKPGKRQEKVLATRTSGFRSPVFTLLLSQLQSNSFYNKQINIASKSYVNPFLKGSMPKYWFRLEDTITHYPGDTGFILSYRPRKGINFDGLRGVVTVNSKSWAFENITAKPAIADDAGINVRIEQNYKEIENNLWFPSQQNTMIFLGTVQANGIPLIGRGKRYIFDVQVNSKDARDFNPAIAMDYAKGALSNADEVLKNYRRVPFSEKDLETYRVIDSIGRAENLTAKLKIFQSLMNGDLKLGKVNLPLNYLIDQNRYEGWRTGLGFETNRDFSDYIMLSAYGAYGFKDKAIKYGWEGTVFFDRYHRHSMAYDYCNDLEEAGVFTHRKKLSLTDPRTYRNFGVSAFSDSERHQLSLKTRIIPSLKISATVAKEIQSPVFDYSYGQQAQDGRFRFFESGLKIRFAPGERVARQLQKEVSLGTKWPVLQLNYQKGINGSEGDYSYHRLFFRLADDFDVNLIGTTSWHLAGGYVSDEVPLMKLFHGKGSSGAFFFSPESFNTMGFGEFYHQRFVSMFFSHNFHQLLWKGSSFSPDIQILHHMIYGVAPDTGLHNDFEIKDTRKGYFESGINLANILKMGVGGVGFSVFYRYGPYARKSIRENLTISLSLSFFND